MIIKEPVKREPIVWALKANWTIKLYSYLILYFAQVKRKNRIVLYMFGKNIHITFAKVSQLRKKVPVVCHLTFIYFSEDPLKKMVELWKRKLKYILPQEFSIEVSNKQTIIVWDSNALLKVLNITVIPKMRYRIYFFRSFETPTQERFRFRLANRLYSMPSSYIWKPRQN